MLLHECIIHIGVSCCHHHQIRLLQGFLRKFREVYHLQIAILEEGMKFNAFTMPMEDAQYVETRKFGVIDEVKARLAGTTAQVDDTDGVRVTTDDGWWLLRASNTQDVLVARAESDSQAGLERLIAQIDEQLASSGLERGPAVGH